LRYFISFFLSKQVIPWVCSERTYLDAEIP
jgi:hypothetical protein